MFKKLEALLMSSKRKQHLRELYGRHYIFNESFIKEVYTSDEYIIEYFKNNPDILKQREKEWQNLQRENYEANEKKRKEMIKNRIFAYDYEETLFQIFAPYAVYKGGVWMADSFKPINKDLIVSKISELRKVSINEAMNIFDGLEKNNILLEFGGGKYILSLINSISDWDVVSDTDMNLDKWMVSHGYDNK